MSGRLLITCEHASASVPARLRYLFDGDLDVLKTHEAVDLGAAEAAKWLARKAAVPCLSGEVTRLLVDLNRSRTNSRVFSRFSEQLGADARRELLDRYWEPHRARVYERIERERGTVVHVGVHSFVARLRGEDRRADIALLYDPKRAVERSAAGRWHAWIRTRVPELRVRRNYPYRGAADGLTTSLRRKYPASRYLGFELEINQGLLVGGRFSRALLEIVAASMAEWNLSR